MCLQPHTKNTSDQKETDILNDRLESLEKVVQEMARTLYVLQTEISNQEHISNDKIEAESNVVNSKKDLDGSILEQKSENKKLK